MDLLYNNREGGKVEDFITGICDGRLCCEARGVNFGSIYM